MPTTGFKIWSPSDRILCQGDPSAVRFRRRATGEERQAATTFLTAAVFQLSTAGVISGNVTAGRRVEGDQEECRTPAGARGFDAARICGELAHSWRGSDRDKLSIVSPAHRDVAHRPVRNHNGGPNEGANVMTRNALRAWTSDPAEFPSTGTLVDKARLAVGDAILSPSSPHTQPGKLPVIADELLLTAGRSRRRRAVDRFERALGIGGGAALLVCARCGLPVGTATLPRAAAPDLLARMSFPRVTTAPNESLASISGRAPKRIRQTLERVLRRAAISRYQASYLNQMVPIGGERSRQLMLRPGRGPSVRHPPRRRFEDVRS